MTVIIIGSSGGGMATLGHSDPVELITTIHKELGRIPAKDGCVHGVVYALFVSCSSAMDSVDPNTDVATLWTVGNFDGSEADAAGTFQVKPSYTGLLKEVNEKVIEIEKNILAPAIRSKSSNIKGMICISCDPSGANCTSLTAAAERNLSITGSGGTSLSLATSLYGLSLVGNAGGSVATTNYTKAVSYCYALANSWGPGQEYTPFAESLNGSKDAKKPSLGSILDACLPSFLAVGVGCRLLDISKFLLSGSVHFSPMLNLVDDQFISQLKYQALPSVCAIVAATSLAPEHSSTAVMAAAVASMACWGSILSGLLAGWLISLLLGRALFTCIKFNIPATMSNILVAGLLGLSVSFLFHCSGAVYVLSKCAEYTRIAIRASPIIHGYSQSLSAAYGFLVGCIFCYGAKVGWYHSIFLPGILLEMESGEMSIWGSVDECTLVLVSAGICAANTLTSGDALPKRALRINLICGDFIEVAYPYMSKSKIVNIAGYLASGISTAILYSKQPSNVMSSAYLPMPLSLILADDWLRLGLAMMSAFLIALMGMICSNLTDIRNHDEKKKGD